MNQSTKTNRRNFLKTTAFAAAAGPAIIRNLRSAPPSGRVIHASFGANGMARTDLNQISQVNNVQIAAAADVDLTRAEWMREKWPGIRIYQDWRELLDKEKDLDSVNVSTPDHMHAPIAMSAMNLGIPVYGQKPLTHDIYETRRLTEKAREKNLVTQMGIQRNSSIQYRRAVKIVQSGAIGKIKEVHTWSNKKWGDSEPMPDRIDPIPAEFSWNVWLGVGAERPFIGGGWYHPGNWRKRLDFGTGTFGDMGCHIYDPVFKALALTAPVSVRSEGAAPNEHSWAIDAIVKYVFPGNQFSAGKTVGVTWYDGDQRPPDEIINLAGGNIPEQGSVFLGTGGVMVLGHVMEPQLFPENDFKDYEPPEAEDGDHWLQFIEAVRGNGKTLAGFDYSGPLTESVLLGSVASRFPNTTLEWDAANLRFSNNQQASQYLRRTYRRGWEVEGL
jgi:predicted dehydrogenase